MAKETFRIDDLMIFSADGDPGRGIYIRELLDYPSAEFKSSKLSAQQKVSIIEALGLETLIPVLAECFRRKGVAYDAEDEARFAWKVLCGWGTKRLQ